MADEKVRKQAGRKRKRRQLSEKHLKGNGGRPKTVGVRLSGTEKDELLAQAKRQNTNMGTILRNCWLGKESTTVPMPEVLGPAAAPPRVMSTAELTDYHAVVAVAIKVNKLTDLLQPDGQLYSEVVTLFRQLRHFLQDLVPPRADKKVV
jgi:hypothetical protein